MKKLLHFYTKGAGVIKAPALYATDDSFYRSPRVWRLGLAGSRGGLVDLSDAGEDVLDVLVGRQRDRGVARRGDRTLASVLQALVEGLGVARVARQLVVRTLDRVVALLGGRGVLAKIGALGFLLALLRNLRYDRQGGQSEHRQKRC